MKKCNNCTFQKYRFGKTVKTLFFNIFGYGDIFEQTDLVVNSTSDAALRRMFANISSGGTNDSIPSNKVVQHGFTELVGYNLIAAYHIVMVVVLLNMLIAIMANSYNAIEVYMLK